MADLENLTPFAFGTAFGYDLDDRALVVLCVAGRFALPAPGGRGHDGALAVHEEQKPPPMADQHWGSPAETSLKNVGQGAVRRAGAEVYVRGSAYAKNGRQVAAMKTFVAVGPLRKEADIIGERRWVRSLGEMAVTDPRPFTSMPLTYERTYGGTAHDQEGKMVAQEARNPIGRGLYARPEDAADQPLPNVTKPGERITSWKQSATPWGYGPIPGSWQPRLGFAGTFDQKWMDDRMPFWPRDTDPRFFGAAAAGMATPEPFRGGEPVMLDGFAPEGSISFRLPEYRIVAKSTYADRTTRGSLCLDGVLIDSDERAVTLFWRRTEPLDHGATSYLHSIVRLLEPWETAPE